MRGLWVDFEGRARIFLDIIDVRCERKREVKSGSKIFGLSNWKDEVTVK